MLSSVDLPLPDGPSSTTNSPAYEVEVDAAQRVHLDLAHAVDLGEAPGDEHGGSRGGDRRRHLGIIDEPAVVRRPSSQRFRQE